MSNEGWYVSRLVFWTDIADNEREMLFEGSRGDLIHFLQALARSPLVRLDSVDVIALNLENGHDGRDTDSNETLAFAITSKRESRARARRLRGDSSTSN